MNPEVMNKWKRPADIQGAWDLPLSPFPTLCLPVPALSAPNFSLRPFPSAGCVRFPLAFFFARPDLNGRPRCIFIYCAPNSLGDVVCTREKFQVDFRILGAA